MFRLKEVRLISLALAAVLFAGGASALADPYFEIWSFDDWDAALTTGHVVPLQPHEWDQYMDEWTMYTEEGDPYPSTTFIPAELYPYNGSEVPPDPDGSGGLVMAWGDATVADGSYASAWKYDYQVDPDLTNAIITLVVYPPQFGVNGGGITQISFGIQDINGNTRSWYWNVGPGMTLPWNVGTPVTINLGQLGVTATTPTADAFMNNPGFNIAMSQFFIADENGRIIGGQVPVPPPGGPPTAVWNYWYNIVVSPGGGPGNYMFEFSLDIGSDAELSDPQMNGNEAFDPGDVYWWQSAPVVPPGRDGFKDDLRIFNYDPYPDPPDATGGSRVPVGTGGTIKDYRSYFDLDGHDQTDFTLVDSSFPISMFPSQCVYYPKYLMISMDDDMAPGWPAVDVPVTVPSPAGLIYGTTPGQDEVIGVNVQYVPAPPPYPVTGTYPIADEVTVHQSLAPNPDNGDPEDDDVDSLDIVENEDLCPYWFFSADHEAYLGLDPGGIYEVTPGGPIQVIDEALHLGIPEETDIDAFEFAWMDHPQEPGWVVLVLLYSVDEDDPLTPLDESGGMNPAQIYVSAMMGMSYPFCDPLWDDIDALTIWREPLEEEEKGACCYGDTSLLCVETTQQDCLQNLLGDWKGLGTTCIDADGSGVADICEDVGACCYGDPVQCVVTTQWDCEQNLLGDWKGAGTDCTDADNNGIADICEDLGACCYGSDGTLCVVTTQWDCLQNLTGTWMGAGTDCTDADGNNIADICEEPDDYLFEFSLDIASDTELSDPNINGNEAFDPGDVYWWQSAPVVPPGRDGFKDDRFIFGGDPNPDPPDPTVPPSTRVPVPDGGVDEYWLYFDLDGHDQIDVDLYEMQWIPPDMPLSSPLPIFPSMCIYPPKHMMISMDDDQAPGWPANDVPVTVPSPAGMIYGTTARQDEIQGLTLLMGGPPPYPILSIYPIADEITVHQSLVPNPDNGEEEDDDVDSLDIVPGRDECPFWYFTADHEARMQLDPGDIYQVMGGWPAMVVDAQMHLGLPDEVDVDAFEFTFLEDPDEPGALFFGIVFSVDEDDPLTPLVDESGGLNPFAIYGSFFTGWFFPVVEELEDDVDALTIWRDTLEQPPVWCLGDMNCTGGVPEFTDINYFVAAIGNESGWWVYYQTKNGGASPPCPWLVGDYNYPHNGVEFTDIVPFANSIGQPCIPYVP